MTYKPIKDGIKKSSKLVTYVEVEPPSHLGSFVHCYWELKTISPLRDNFHYHVIPDACVNILFDQKNPQITGVTAINTEAIVLDLGKEFHFTGIQLLPGIWQGRHADLQSALVDTPYRGELDLEQVNEIIFNQNFDQKQKIFSNFVEKLIATNIITLNPITGKILANLDSINSVIGMAKIANLSTRQLQRKIKSSTGFSPHDFLKVLRIQKSFREDYLYYYADQSHFIHSFRKIIGYTPGEYFNEFDV